MSWISRVSVIALTVAALGVVTAAQTPSRQTSVTAKEMTLRVRLALERLPYYGVFDFLAFSVDRGTVTLMGYAYRPTLKSEAEQAVKRIPGIDEVANKIEILPVSQNDDRIRWAAFYNIYTDDFLSRYAPGGPASPRYALEQHAFSHFPGMQPLGNYPIQIIVKNGRMTLLGIVDNAADKMLAGVRARQGTLTFGVENELVVSKE
jgi:hypothetical protein